MEANKIALEGVRAEEQVGQRTVLDVLDAEQELLNSQVSLVTSRRDLVVASYTLLAAVGRLSPSELGLPSETYDPDAHYRDVKDRPFGFRWTTSVLPIEDTTVVGGEAALEPGQELAEGYPSDAERRRPTLDRAGERRRRYDEVTGAPARASRLVTPPASGWLHHWNKFGSTSCRWRPFCVIHLRHRVTTDERSCALPARPDGVVDTEFGGVSGDLSMSAASKESHPNIDDILTSIRELIADDTAADDAASEPALTQGSNGISGDAESKDVISVLRGGGETAPQQTTSGTDTDAAPDDGVLDLSEDFIVTDDPEQAGSGDPQTSPAEEQPEDTWHNGVSESDPEGMAEAEPDPDPVTAETEPAGVDQTNIWEQDFQMPVDETGPRSPFTALRTNPESAWPANDPFDVTESYKLARSQVTNGRFIAPTVRKTLTRAISRARKPRPWTPRRNSRRRRK